jgi:hypothetical protein
MDTRSRIDKLRAMAAEGNGASEGERANARAMLANMGVGMPPPKPPTAVGASPESFDDALRRTQQRFRDAQDRAMRDERMRTMFGRRQDAGYTSSTTGNTTSFDTGYIHVSFEVRRTR